MNWFHKILCLFVVILFTSLCVNAENNEGINSNHAEEELIPPEQILDTHDAEISERKTPAQLSNALRQACVPYHISGWNFGNNIRFPFGHGLIANPLVGHSLDAQASSPSNNVVLVLANEKNKLAELTKPAEESLKRLVRNPDAVDDIAEHFNLFGGNMAQRMFQQVAQTAPELSRSFGQALSEVLAQTSALAQTPPGNFNLSQLTPSLGAAKRSENVDFGQLGQRLSQSFLLGAAPNLMKSQTSENTKEAEPVTATAQAAGSDAAAETASSLTQPNPLVGHPLLPPLNFGLPPMGLFRPLRLFNPLMPLASEISEVRVKPDDYNPYKLTPKPVDHQTMAEMRLKALLRDALAKKTIPILWFHLPSSQGVHKSPEDLETEAKLKIFEKQVIAELEQLQELSKLANELKTTQLQSGSNPTPSLTTKLNLSEIPIYDITLGDIEKTLEDEHVRMLMHTITQNQHKELHRHHQATTQYLTDLTGNPIKRQTSSDDVLKTMEKDDLLNMMSYAYRMATMNGQMPWLKSEEQMPSMAMEAEMQTKMSNEGKPTDMSSQMLMQNPTTPTQRPTEAINQRQMPQQNTFAMQWADHNNMPLQRQSMMSNTEMAMEKQWLEDKQKQMLVAAEQQRNINDETKTSNAQQNEFSSQTVNRNMPTQSQSMMGNTEMTAEKQWLADKQRQMAMEAEMKSKTNNEGRSTDMSSQMFMQNPTTHPQRPTETISQRQMPQQMHNRKPTANHPNTFARQWFDQNMLSQMLMQNPTTPPQRSPPQTIMERQIPQQMMIMQNPTTSPHRPPPEPIMDRQIPQGMPNGRPTDTHPNTFARQWFDHNMLSQMLMQNPMTPPQRPPQQAIMERQQTAQQMMIMQNPTTSPHRPPPEPIMDRQQTPQQMMIMQNATTPSHRPPPEPIMDRQIPQGMPNGRPTDTHPNTFARHWFDQNMLSQMLMQNPTTPPQRLPPQTIMERQQTPQQMMIMQNPTTPLHRPPPEPIMDRQQTPQQMMIMQNPTTSPHRPPPEPIMDRQQTPQQMMIMQNPTTSPHRPPPEPIMDRQQTPQQMMIMQNPTTSPHRPPPEPIMDRQQTPQQMMIMQNPTTPSHRPPPEPIMDRQIPQGMPNGRPTDTHPNTFARYWFDQNMLSQMLMQNPMTPPQRPAQQAIMERQQTPQQMMIMQNPTTSPQAIMESQTTQEMSNEASEAEKQTKMNNEGKMSMQNEMPQIVINNEPMPTQPEQKQEMDAKSNTQPSEAEAIQEQGSDSVTNSDTKDTKPTLNEATPQTAEDADKPRFGGLKNLFDLDVFQHGKNKEKPTVINYYYNTGGNRYPTAYNGGYGQQQPQPTPTYYQGPTYASKYKPSGSVYGGGGYGSNAYGSYGGGYRAAVGDEEIARMLQQQQLLPSQITMPNDDDPLNAINTTTTMEMNNADTTTTKNLNKRFAKNNHNNNGSPAAYLVVVRNNNNSKKSRSKRSAEEFTTLEPIDENSLNALRKTYKNSLKEITLKPNETPSEALMRYKAESIREALVKANQVPMELTADSEHYEGAKEESKEAEAQQQGHTQAMPSTSYVLSANEQFKAPQSYMDNELYTAVPVPQHQPLAMAYNQQPEVVYESPQEGLYNNYVIKYNNPAAYDSNSKILPQNPYLSMYNSLDAAPYVDEYRVDNHAYQMANQDDINANSFVYPQVNGAQAYAIEAPNALAKEIQGFYSPAGHIKASEFTNYQAGLTTKKNPYLFTNVVSKHQTLNTYNQLRPTPIEYSKGFNTLRTQEKLSFENLIAVIKERLTECCNECKNKILKSLDESRNAYSPPLLETYHTLTYRNPQVEENFEYKHWLMDMAEKGYDQNYLNNRHQEEYLRDGRLNLHITTEDAYGQGDGNMFFKNNQSYKRETTEPNMEKEAKTEVVIATIKIDNSLEKETNEAGDDEVDQQDRDEEKEMVVEELQSDEKEKEEKMTEKPLKLEESINKIEKVELESKQNLENNTKAQQRKAESTTRSVYAMRGQFRSEKQRPKPFSMAQAKHFDNYKHINKIGKTNALIKAEETNQKKGKEIVIILRKETNEQEATTANNQQVTTTESNVISKAISNETKAKKITSKRLRTSLKNQMPTQNSSESNSSAESIG